MSAEDKVVEEKASDAAAQAAPAENAAEQAEPPAAPVEEVAEAPAAEPSPAEQIAAAQKEAADWKARAYRATADLENMRRRFAKEREDMRKFGVTNFLKDILPVIDNLERAVQAAQDPDDAVATGVRMVLRQFTTKAEIYGARPFDALGQEFDPTIHEAMSQVETADYAPGSVAQVFQRGWMLHDRLVRPAMVIVAKAPPAPEPEAEPTPETTVADEAASEDDPGNDE